jgi:hypothetical protein
MPGLAERFEALVDRSGEHHLWLGAVDAHQTPQMRVDGTLTTARRVAWVLAHGPLRPGVRIAACPDQPRCVRAEHLHLGPRPRPRSQLTTELPDRRRAPHGAGTTREVRPGVWKLTVTVTGGGRVNRTVEGDTDDARRQLAVLAVQQRGGARTLDRLVAAHLAQLHDTGRAAETLSRYQQLWRDWLSPTLGHLPPDRVGRTDIEDALEAMAGAGMSTRSIHQATGVISSALAWACERGDLAHNPAIGAQLPDGTQRGPARQRS